MLIVMNNDATEAQIARVVEVITEMGYEGRPMPGALKLLKPGAMLRPATSPSKSICPVYSAYGTSARPLSNWPSGVPVRLSVPLMVARTSA